MTSQARRADARYPLARPAYSSSFHSEVAWRRALASRLSKRWRSSHDQAQILTRSRLRNPKPACMLLQMPRETLLYELLAASNTGPEDLATTIRGRRQRTKQCSCSTDL